MAKAWKATESGEPTYPDNYAIEKKCVLQVTDIVSNHNKYYGIEMHSTKGKCKFPYRIFTHYGRTDDLERNPNTGAKESRYFSTQGEAEAEYNSIYKSKTSNRKGYQEVSLASSKIGSEKARGQSSGNIDDKTLKKIVVTTKAAPAPKIILPKEVQELTRYIYSEATNKLTSTVAAKITANGIETPLGVLTLGQIEKGEKILGDIFAIYKKKRIKSEYEKVKQLCSAFYTSIPHKIGRTRAEIDSAIMTELTQFEDKQQTIQLMKDMLQVNSQGNNVLFNSQVESEYSALKCDIVYIDPGTKEFEGLNKFIQAGLVKKKALKVKNLFKVKREAEWKVYDNSVGNVRQLLHGSRIQNWVGILSRGMVLPKIAVSMGINRTDGGWLGNGIYFGDAACTCTYYAAAGRKGTSLIGIASVALGKMKPFTKITYGLDSPPPGFDSCHGIPSRVQRHSEFEDNEYVIYQQNRQRLEYIIEV